MGRLSVSLGEDQQEWISAKAEELDLSKGKVVRECIDEVRTDNSLFSTQVQSTDSSQSDRIETLENRIESLEEAVLNGTTTAQSDDESPGVKPGRHDESSSAPAREDRPADDTATAGMEASGATDEEPVDSGQDDQNLESVVAASAGPSNAAGEDSSGSGETSDTTADDTFPEELQEHADRLSADLRGRLEETDTSELDKTDPSSVRAFLDSMLDDGAYVTVVFTCWQKLHQRGTLHARSMKSLYEEYPLDYDDEGTWWTGGVEPVLRLLPGVAPPEGGGNLYRFKY